MTTYRVRSGDTLGKIAKRFYGDPGRYALIVTANAIANPDRLKVGQELLIPDPATPAAPPAPPPAPPAPPPPPPPTAAASRTAQLNVERLARLHPIVATRGQSMLELSAHAGLAVLVTQGLRTWEEQDALYAKGRSVPPLGKAYIVTQAKGGQSYHNFGLAFDIVVLDSVGKADWETSHPGWTAAAQIGKSVGLEWGGDWRSFKDLPHYQYTNGLALEDCRTLFAAGGLPAVWARVT